MDSTIHLRFDEVASTERPRDAADGLAELDVVAGLTMPTIVDGVTGRARSFLSSSSHGIQALDQVAGSTLHTRDVTIQTILRWDVAAQAAHANPGTIIARGKGNASNEYMPYALEIRVVNAIAGVGEIRFLWHDIAGNLKTQLGAHFQATSTFLMLTATRRWISSAEVLLRYYLGDELLSENTSVDGSIGGGTTGTTAIGSRFTGGAYARFFSGAIDELRVVPREMCIEEIQATWKRLAIFQPLTRSLVRELHPPGFPMSTSPESRVQRENSIWGDVLGYASAQAENMRDNLMPDRAFGDALERWEGITRQAPKPNESTELRRSRVVAKIAQKAGMSIEGVQAALLQLVDTDVDNLEFLAFDQTVVEDFTALSTERWDPRPAADHTIASGELRVQAIAGTFVTPDTWKRCFMPIGGDGRGAQAIVKLIPTTIPANAHCGVAFGSDVTKNYVFVGLRFTGAVYRIDTLIWINGILVSSPPSINIGAGKPSPIWFHLYNTLGIGYGSPTTPSDFVSGYSVTGPDSGFIYSAPFSAATAMQLAGTAVLSVGATASPIDVTFDDAVIRAPCGERSFFGYAYRNPALPGTPDTIGANANLRALRHAFTHFSLITSKSVLCDDPTCPCDAGPLGGI
jgi:hypothetical protein